MAKENFENNLAKLEEIVANLEKGDLSLENSLEQYKEGISLIKKCNSIIENAEKEVAKISEELRSDE